MRFHRNPSLPSAAHMAILMRKINARAFPPWPQRYAPSAANEFLSGCPYTYHLVLSITSHPGTDGAPLSGEPYVHVVAA
jgi:hypothetical protein